MMRDREWMHSNPGRAALAALAVCATLCGWTLVHAIRIDRVPDLAVPAFATGAAFAAPPKAEDVDISGAVDADLFAPDRTAPAERYRAPGEEVDEPAARAPVVLPIVIGTAVSDVAHSFATIQLADGKPVILRVGDRIGEYTVQSIESGHVIFTNAARKKLDIPELKP